MVFRTPQTEVHVYRAKILLFTRILIRPVLREQLRKAEEREQQVQQEKARLLALLEAEQQARRELETKLLPAPRSTAVSKGRLWALAILLLVALAGLVVTLIRPELIGGLTGGLLSRNDALN